MISIIIPTFNEGEQIAQTINAVKKAAGDGAYEIIVSDGGSNDDTIAIVKATGTTTFISNKKGRAAQMNAGTLKAKSDVFYFLHADCKPPENFIEHISNAMHRGFSSGCFRLQFNYKHWFLKASAWFTNYNINAVRFGDQSLFVTKDVFIKSGGFREDLFMMEDQEIIHRLKQNGKFVVMKDYIITSARKYQDNGIYRMQAIFFRLWFLYYMGCSQKRLLKLHKKLIKNNKL